MVQKTTCCLKFNQLLSLYGCFPENPGCGFQVSGNSHSGLAQGVTTPVISIHRPQPLKAATTRSTTRYNCTSQTQLILKPWPNTINPETPAEVLAQVGVHVFQIYPLATPQIHEEICQLNTFPMPSLHITGGLGQPWPHKSSTGHLEIPPRCHALHRAAPSAVHQIVSPKCLDRKTSLCRYAGWWMMHDGDDSNAASVPGLEGDTYSKPQPMSN